MPPVFLFLCWQLAAERTHGTKTLPKRIQMQTLWSQNKNEENDEIPCAKSTCWSSISLWTMQLSGHDCVQFENTQGEKTWSNQTQVFVLWLQRLREESRSSPREKKPRGPTEGIVVWYAVFWSQVQSPEYLHLILVYCKQLNVGDKKEEAGKKHS